MFPVGVFIFHLILMLVKAARSRKTFSALDTDHTVLSINNASNSLFDRESLCLNFPPSIKILQSNSNLRQKQIHVMLIKAT